MEASKDMIYVDLLLKNFYGAESWLFNDKVTKEKQKPGQMYPTLKKQLCANIQPPLQLLDATAAMKTQDLHNEQWEGDIVVMLRWYDPRVAGLVPKDCIVSSHAVDPMPNLTEFAKSASVCKDQTGRTLSDEQAQELMWTPVPLPLLMLDNVTQTIKG